MHLKSSITENMLQILEYLMKTILSSASGLTMIYYIYHISLSFYQDYSNTIKEDLTKVFLEFHNNGVINNSTNATFIALAPKGNNMSTVVDFRPISLTTSPCKVCQPKDSLNEL